MSIIDLREEPDHIPTLAQWHHAEWSYLNPGGQLAARIERMQSYLGEDLVPSAFVYKDEGELAGSASIVAHDMDTHPELSPWLASVYVNPGHRGRGFGAKLVLHVMQQARVGGIDALYLFTDGKRQFYEKLGWRVWSREIYRGCEVTIMQAVLLD